MSEPTEVAENVVVEIEYTLTVDGEVLDSSKDEGPLEFLQGFQNIIPGLEKGIAGMKVGDSKSVVVAPVDGYGEFEEDSIRDVPRDEFPPDVPMELGIEIHVTDHDGHTMLSTIVEVGNESIKLDTNHPLAGKELHFDVKIIGLREATKDEMEHGHVHSDGQHHH